MRAVSGYVRGRAQFRELSCVSQFAKINTYIPTISTYNGTCAREDIRNDEKYMTDTLYLLYSTSITIFQYNVANFSLFKEKVFEFCFMLV